VILSICVLPSADVKHESSAFTHSERYDVSEK